MEQSSWKNFINDKREQQVFTALDDSKWDYRTIGGLVKSTGLSQDYVSDVISKYPNLIRKSLVPDRRGRELYQLVERKKTQWEFWKTIKTFITKST